MAKFVFLYTGGQMAGTPEAQEQAMQAWGAWFAKLGGSVLATPRLLYVVGVRDPHVAVGTSSADARIISNDEPAGPRSTHRTRIPRAMPGPLSHAQGSRLGVVVPDLARRPGFVHARS